MIAKRPALLHKGAEEKRQTKTTPNVRHCQLMYKMLVPTSCRSRTQHSVGKQVTRGETTPKRLMLMLMPMMLILMLMLKESII